MRYKRLFKKSEIAFKYTIANAYYNKVGMDVYNINNDDKKYLLVAMHDSQKFIKEQVIDKASFLRIQDEYDLESGFNALGFLVRMLNVTEVFDNQGN